MRGWLNYLTSIGQFSSRLRCKIRTHREGVGELTISHMGRMPMQHRQYTTYRGRARGTRPRYRMFTLDKESGAIRWTTLRRQLLQCGYTCERPWWLLQRDGWTNKRQNSLIKVIIACLAACFQSPAKVAQAIFLQAYIKDIVALLGNELLLWSTWFLSS